VTRAPATVLEFLLCASTWPEVA